MKKFQLLPVSGGACSRHICVPANSSPQLWLRIVCLRLGYQPFLLLLKRPICAQVLSFSGTVCSDVLIGV